jgi:hypothetical protein
MCKEQMSIQDSEEWWHKEKYLHGDNKRNGSA